MNYDLEFENMEEMQQLSYIVILNLDFKDLLKKISLVNIKIKSEKQFLEL